MGLYRTDETPTLEEQGSSTYEEHGGGHGEASKDPEENQDKERCTNEIITTHTNTLGETGSRCSFLSPDDDPAKWNKWDNSWWMKWPWETGSREADVRNETIIFSSNSTF